MLCAVAVLCCGCSGSSGQESVSAVSKASTSSDAAFTVPPNTSQSERSNEITYFGSKDISNISEMYAKNSGVTVKIEQAGGSGYIDTLSKKISADNSPDLCDKVDNTFPYLISMNLYEDLTNYIDTTSPQWLNYTDVIERYSFKGGRYFYPTTVTVMPEFLIYVKTKYIQCGNLPDPEKQWMKNEWTWDEFRQGASGILDSEFGGADVLVSGSGVFDNFLAASGKSLFPLNGSRFVNGLSTANAERVYDLLSYYELDYTDITDAADKIESVVFLSGDEGTLAELRKTDLTIGVVPYPRDEKSEIYYCKAVAEGFLVPKGAKNIQSAASFINSSRISDASEEQQEKNDKKLIESGLLRSDVEWLRELRGSEQMTPILVDVNCFDDNANAAAYRIMTYSGEGPWFDVLAENSPMLDSAIDSINAVIE